MTKTVILGQWFPHCGCFSLLDIHLITACDSDMAQVVFSGHKTEGACKQNVIALSTE